MKNKLLLVLLFVCVFVVTMCIKDGFTQSFQMLYAKQIQFEYNGAGVILQPGMPLKTGAQTITIPDGAGTIFTTYSNSNFLLTTLKAIDAVHGSHSGINWTSLGV